MKLAEFLCGQSDSTYLTLKPQPLPHLLSSDFTGQKQADSVFGKMEMAT